MEKAKDYNFAALDSRAKRDTIPRLLMEYELGSLAEDEDYQAFKSDLMAELGISLYDDNDLEKAKDILTQALETDNLERGVIGKPKAYCYLGIIDGRQEKWELALRFLNQAIAEFEAIGEEQNYPDLKKCLIRAIASRGKTYQLMNRYLEALDDFTYAIEFNPEYKWAILQRGQTYYLNREYTKALGDFDKAFALDKKDSWTVRKCGAMHLLLGQYNQALQDFNCSLQLKADSNWTLYLRALAYKAFEQTENSKVDLDQAIKLAQQGYEQDPYHHRNTFNLALYCLAAQKCSQADYYYQDAVSKEPASERIRAAMRDLEDLLTVFPDYPNAENMRSYLISILDDRQVKT